MKNTHFATKLEQKRRFAVRKKTIFLKIANLLTESETAFRLRKTSNGIKLEKAHFAEKFAKVVKSEMDFVVFLKSEVEVQKEPFIMSLEGPVLIYQVQSVQINFQRFSRFAFWLISCILYESFEI